MISLIGNIKIANNQRFKYLISTIKSFYFAKDIVKYIHINIENLKELPNKELNDTLSVFDQYKLYDMSKNFGEIYMNLLNQIDTKYFWHFEEDHFCVLNNINILKEILCADFDMCKSSFYYIEQKCAKQINHYEELGCGKIYRMTEDNWKKFSIPYGNRYYIGNNSIFNLNFGKKYWSRNIDGNRPHVFEVPRYNIDLEHNMMVPENELLCAIDDDHGEPNTCILKRQIEKWNTIYEK